jgi:hypothetical protein
MLADHTMLQGAVEKLAAQFKVTLPDKPTSSQQAWIAEISSKTGADFDQTFANRLRAAHGTVFGLIAEVRAGTGNDAIRAFATTANTIVMRHMTLLEATGLVGPHGRFAEAGARQASYPENTLDRSKIILAILLGAVMLFLTLAVVRTVSRRGAAEG